MSMASKAASQFGASHIKRGMRAQLASVVKDMPSREVYRRTKEGWGSSKLHDIGPKMSGGLAVRRLRAMADFLEEVDFVAPTVRVKGRDWAPGPVANIGLVNGQHECRGYMLTAGGDGLGMSCFPSTGDARFYYLTGYGIACWAWGQTNGMAALCEREHTGLLDEVLTADPVRRHLIDGLEANNVRGGHVAAAIRYFLNEYKTDGGQVALNAWRHAAGITLPPREEPQGEDTPQEPVQDAVEAPLAPVATESEEWKGLMLNERYSELVALCEGKEAKLQGLIDDLLARQRVWSKRRRSAQVMLDEEDA